MKNKQRIKYNQRRIFYRTLYKSFIGIVFYTFVENYRLGKIKKACTLSHILRTDGILSTLYMTYKRISNYVYKMLLCVFNFKTITPFQRV